MIEQKKRMAHGGRSALRRIALLAFCLSLLSQQVCAQSQPEPPPQYTFGIPVLEADGYVELPLLADLVTRASGADLANLRVSDADGNMVPYALYDETLETSLVSDRFEGQYLSQYEKDGDAFLDFELDRQEGFDVYGTQLWLTSPTRNFAKHMELQGSYDGIAWTYLTADTLYQVEEQSHMFFSFDEPIKYPFYRIKVPNNKEAVAITGVALVYESEAHTLRRFARTFQPSYTLEQRERETVGTIAAPQVRNLPLARFELLTQDVFQRRVALAAVSLDDSGTPIGVYGNDEYVTYSEVKYNLPFEELTLRDTTLQLSGMTVGGDLLFLIDNGDDTPLTIDGVELTYNARMLVFHAQAGVRYHLLLGDPVLPLPSYDLAGYLGQVLKSEQLTQLAYGTVREVETAPLPAEDSGGKMALNLAVGIASILLVALIARSLRGKRTEGAD